VEESIAGEMEQDEKNMRNNYSYWKRLSYVKQKNRRSWSEEHNTLARSASEMPEHTRYNMLKTESKHLQNIIKIICYRAEMAA